VTIKVVIADDQALVRGGFVVMVGAAPDMEVLGEAGDGAQAVEQVRRHRPDVVLMDVRMPVLDGIEATRAITTDPATSSAHILILTTFDLDDYVYRALRAGERPPRKEVLTPAATISCSSASISRAIASSSVDWV